MFRILFIIKSGTKSDTKSSTKNSTKSNSKSGSKIKMMCVPYGAPYASNESNDVFTFIFQSSFVAVFATVAFRRQVTTKMAKQNTRMVTAVTQNQRLFTLDLYKTGKCWKVLPINKEKYRTPETQKEK